MRHTVWDDMRRMHSQMNRLFANFFGESTLPALMDSGQGLLAGPSELFGDVKETENAYLVHMDLPGVEKKDIHVEALDEGIQVRVQSKQQSEGKDAEGSWNEQRFYGCSKYIGLPKNADSSSIHAEYKNGVLRIEVKKKEIEQKNRRLIEVK